MFTAQGPLVLRAIKVAVLQFAQVWLVYIMLLYPNDDRRPCVAMTPYVSKAEQASSTGVLGVGGGGGGGGNRLAK